MNNEEHGYFRNCIACRRQCILTCEYALRRQEIILTDQGPLVRW